MLTKIIMPSGGQTTDEMLLVRWLKQVGDPVQKGDVLFEIETDKATMQVESYGAGSLLAVYHGEGEYVTKGDLVAYVGEPQELPNQAAPQTKAPAKPQPADAEDEYQPILCGKPEPMAEAQLLPAGTVLASPAARQKAKEAGVALSQVAKGTQGVVKRADVERFLEQSIAAVQETRTEDAYEVVRTSPMRATIARRMSESVRTAPTFTVTMEIDMAETMAMRDKINGHLKAAGEKISFNDILMQCVAKVMGDHPMIQALYGEQEIRIPQYVNIGLAVGLPEGLVVPVLRNAEQKSLRQIAKENETNIQKAKQGKLTPEDRTGGTITISNLGMFGVDSFTAILNQPESCILAVGAITDKPAAYGGQLAIRPMMTITATFDHRVIDGAYGAAFLRDVKALLENPWLLVL